MDIECASSIDFPKIIQQNIEFLREDFTSSLHAAWKQYQALQKNSGKGELYFVKISFLRSGILLNSAWFQLDLLDENEWGDILECTFDLKFEDVVKPVCVIDTMLALDKEKRMLEHAADFLSALRGLMPEFISEIKNSFPKVKFELGEYMGDYTAI